MSKHEPEQTRMEQFAKQFAVPKPSEALKREILASARSAWSPQAETKAHGDSLVPYFAALAATLLLIIAINGLGDYALKAEPSDYVVTIRRCQASQLNEELSANMPYGRSIALCIVGVRNARYKTHFSQLQTLLSQAASL